MYKYRITKYNPLFRDDRGTYQKEEWTSVYDIVNGKYEFGMKEYIDTENKYIDMINVFLKCIGENEAICVGFEEGLSVDEVKAFQEKYFADEDDDMVQLYEKLYKNNFLKNSYEIFLLVRMVLREYLWCEIKIGESMIKFGYDYYMYFVTENDCLDTLTGNCSDGMFVEVCD